MIFTYSEAEKNMKYMISSWLFSINNATDNTVDNTISLGALTLCNCTLNCKGEKKTQLAVTVYIYFSINPIEDRLT